MTTTTKGHTMIKKTDINKGDIVKVSMAHLGLGPHFVRVTDLDADDHNGCEIIVGRIVVPTGRAQFLTAIGRDGRRPGSWARVAQVVEVNPDPLQAAADCPELVDARTADERNAARKAGAAAERARLAAIRKAERDAAAAAAARPCPFALQLEGFDPLAALLGTDKN
jgi:hypothetical protein